MGSAELAPTQVLMSTTSGSKSLRLRLRSPSAFSNATALRPMDFGLKRKEVESEEEVSLGQDEPLDFSSKQPAFPSRKERSAESKEQGGGGGGGREEAERQSPLTRHHVKAEMERLQNSRDNAIKSLLNHKQHLEHSPPANRANLALSNGFSAKGLQNGAERLHQSSNSTLDLPLNFLNPGSNANGVDYRSASHSRPFKSYNLRQAYLPYAQCYGVPIHQFPYLNGATGLDPRLVDPAALPMTEREEETMALFKKIHLQQQQQQQLMAQNHFQNHSSGAKGGSQMYNPRHLEALQRSAQAPAFPGDFWSSKAHENRGGGGPFGAPSPTTSVTSSNSSSASPQIPYERNPSRRRPRPPSSPLYNNPSPDLTRLSKTLHSSSIAAGSKPNCTSVSPSTSVSNESRGGSVSPAITTGSEHHNAVANLLLTTANINAHFHSGRTGSALDGAQSSMGSGSEQVTLGKKRGRSLPEDQKDSAYWERRRKNNEAAKRSRDARRAKEDEIAVRCAYLEQENIRLKVEKANLQRETSELRCLLYST